MSNLKQIGLGIIMYQDDHEHIPDSLSALVDDGYIGARDVFKCPAGGRAMKGEGGLRSSYEYVGKLPPHVDHTVIIAYDRRGNHPRGRNCLFMDGHVEFVSERQLRSNTGHQSLEKSYEKVLDAYGDDLKEKRKKQLKTFYEVGE